MTAFSEINDSFPTDELVRHAVRSIENADYSSDPFPHIFFRDFFPADFYRDMIRLFPESGYREIVGGMKRMALDLHGANLDRIDAEKQAIWRAASATLTSPELEKATRARLHEGLEIRARGDRVGRAEDLRLNPLPVLYKDNDGYQIKPHPDTRKKVITMQIYCPADDSQEALGTTLYQASLKGLINVGSYFLEPVKTMPFLPNVGYAFVVLKAYHSLTRMSWHGRPAITARIEQPRVSIINTYNVDERARA